MDASASRQPSHLDDFRHSVLGFGCGLRRGRRGGYRLGPHGSAPGDHAAPGNGCPPAGRHRSAGGNRGPHCCTHHRPGNDGGAGGYVLNIGFKELGPYSASNKLTESTVWLYVSTSSHEQLNLLGLDGEFRPKVGESWSVDESGTVWTFTLKKGVEFSKGWG